MRYYADEENFMSCFLKCLDKLLILAQMFRCDTFVVHVAEKSGIRESI